MFKHVSAADVSCQ